MRATVLAALCLVALAAPAWARPESYPGGVTAITTNDGLANAALLHYTPNPHWALGYRLEHRRESGANLHLGQVNALLHRWNAQGWQANWYLKTGFGAAHQDGNTAPAGFAGMALDWENRRCFASYENRGLWVGQDTEHSFSQKVRTGIAPYVAEYGALHTWLMLEVTHAPGSEHTWRATPMVRLFRGTAMVEAGMDTRGDILLNAAWRF